MLPSATATPPTIRTTTPEAAATAPWTISQAPRIHVISWPAALSSTTSLRRRSNSVRVAARTFVSVMARSRSCVWELKVSKARCHVRVVFRTLPPSHLPSRITTGTTAASAPSSIRLRNARITHRPRPTTTAGSSCATSM